MNADVVPLVPWRVAEVAMRGLHRLDFASGPNDRLITFSASTFADFLALRDGDGSVLAFVRQWGRLGMCGHRQPASHSSDCRPLPFEYAGCYTALARQARALLNLATALHHGGDAPLDDLRAVVYMQPHAWPLLRSSSAADARELVTVAVNSWLNAAAVRPVVTWTGRDARVLLSGGLFGGIALSLAGAVARHTRDMSIRLELTGRVVNDAA
jgi:hypothetical protein